MIDEGKGETLLYFVLEDCAHCFDAIIYLEMHSGPLTGL